MSRGRRQGDSAHNRAIVHVGDGRRPRSVIDERARQIDRDRQVLGGGAERRLGGGEHRGIVHVGHRKRGGIRGSAESRVLPPVVVSTDVPGVP